jgi:DHA1 family tetracycline resistance protein-like MFS transporter
VRKASILVLFLTVFIDLVGFGMIIPFLSFYAREYGAGGIAVGAVVGVYSIMQFFFAPVWGRLSDRFGRRPVLLISLALNCAGYLLFAFSRSFTLLFASRVIAGIGGANIGTAQAYIADSTDEAGRAKGMGLIGAAFGLGFILGPPLSAMLASLGRSHGVAENLYPGLAAAATSFAAVMIGVFALPESKPKDLVPRSGRPPQFDPRLWREIGGSRILGAIMGALFLTLLAVAGMEIGVTLHGRDRFQFTQREIALLFLFMGVIVAVIQGGLIGRLVRMAGEKRVVVIGAMSFVAGFAVVPSIYRVPWLFGAAFLIAVGQGLCYPALTSLLSKVAPESERGSLLGLGTAVGSLARFIGPIVAGFLYDAAGARGGFWGGALMMVFALVVAALMPARAPAES